MQEMIDAEMARQAAGEERRVLFDPESGCNGEVIDGQFIPHALPKGYACDVRLWERNGSEGSAPLMLEQGCPTWGSVDPLLTPPHAVDEPEPEPLIEAPAPTVPAPTETSAGDEVALDDGPGENFFQPVAAEG